MRKSSLTFESKVVTFLFSFTLLWGGSYAKAEKNFLATVTVGDEEIVYAPGDFYIDGPYFTYQWKGKTYGVLQSDFTSRIENPVASKLTKRETMKGFERLKNGEWDELGRWLIGVYLDGNILHGYYHGESSNDPLSIARNRAKIGYTVSHDGGASWEFPGYPNNDIITGQNGHAYAGDGCLIKLPNRLRLYFNQSDGMYVAESKYSSCGRPGSWKSYKGSGNEGAFSVDSLKENGSRLATFSYAACVTFNTYLQTYLAVDGTANYNPGSGPRKLLLKTSKDGLQWASLHDALPLPQAEDILTLYPSLVGLEGEEGTGQSFWLYYVYVHSVKGGHNKLARVKVTLQKQR